MRIRNAKGCFVGNYPEPKRPRTLRLTVTAWAALSETALGMGISTANLLEQWARSDAPLPHAPRAAIPIGPASVDERFEGYTNPVSDNFECRLTEEALRESEAFNRLILESSADCMQVLDCEGRVRYINPSGLGALELDAFAQIEGADWQDFWSGEDRNAALGALAAARAGGEGRFGGFCPTLKGTPRWWDVQVTPIPAEHGGEERYLCVARDITRTRRQQTWISAQNGVLELLAAGTAPLSEMLTTVARFVEEQTDGTDLCSILLLDAQALCLRHGAAPSLPEAYCRAIDGIAIGPEVGSCGTAAYTGKTVIVTDIATDPKWRDLKDLAQVHGLRACWSVPICDSGGGVLGTLALYYRTTRGPNEHEWEAVAAGTRLAALAMERRLGEEVLAGSEKRYRLLAESIPQLVWTADATGRLLDVNTRWSDFTGLSLAQAREAGWGAVVHPDDIPVLAARWAEAVEAGTAYRAEGRMRRSDGSHRWHLHQAVPFVDGESRVLQWFGTATDIEERKCLEHDRERLLERERAARQAAKEANRVKDEFLAILSHELRTPLNPIIGWTQMLRRGKVPAELQLQTLEIIHRNAKLQNQLIDDMLDISRLISGKFRIELQPTELGSLVTAAIEAVRPLAETKAVALEIGAQVDCRLQVDATRMQQVVWNLLTNAIKFTPQGGKVSIALQQCDGHIAIRVSDTGIGICPEFLPKVFERFRQADSSSTRTHGGLGLGLAIVRQIVEMHGGRVRAESEGEGKGATFTVELPCPLNENESC